MSDRATRVAIDERKIDSIFADLDQCQLPGAAVGIAIDGAPVYRKGFGLASMELPVVLSPAIGMRIGSTTKHFTCLAYMLLCEEGKAALHDALGEYLPELPPIARRVTLRQLMGHVSGLRDVHDICYVFSGTSRPISSAAVLDLYREIDDSNFAPGTAWCYNNGAYVLLSLVIERIADRPLKDVLRQRIFDRVGMYDTVLQGWESDFVPRSASPHMTKAGGGFEKSYLSTERAGQGGVNSSVDDMLRWLAHMDSPVVGSESTWKLMKTPLTLANGTSTGYGFGLISGQYRGVDILHHGGAVMGGNSQMLQVPSAKLSIVVLVNRHDVSSQDLTNSILDACLPGLQPPSAATSREHATGAFRSLTSDRVVQLLSRDGQQLVSINGTEMPFDANAEGVLLPVGVGAFVKQSITLIGDKQQPSAIRLSDFGNTEELVAVKPPSTRDARSISGSYCSTSTRSEVTITDGENGAMMTTVAPFGTAEFRLECLADGIWRARSTSAMPWGGILVFDKADASFRFSTSRTWSLQFARRG